MEHNKLNLSPRILIGKSQIGKILYKKNKTKFEQFIYHFSIIKKYSPKKIVGFFNFIDKILEYSEYDLEEILRSPGSVGLDSKYKLSGDIFKAFITVYGDKKNDNNFEKFVNILEKIDGFELDTLNSKKELSLNFKEESLYSYYLSIIKKNEIDPHTQQIVLDQVISDNTVISDDGLTFYQIKDLMNDKNLISIIKRNYL